MLLLGFLGCGGDDTDTHSGGPAGCDALVSAPLGAVPATEWDPDLGPAMATYDGLAGRWTADTSCGLGRVGLKFVNRTRDELEVVQEPYPAGVPCGCTFDPSFGPDGTYGPLALFTDFEFYVETWDDAGVQGQNVITQGALYPSDAPFQVRACGTQTIDPYLGSEWDDLTTIVRVTGGALGGSVLLSKSTGESSSCDLTDFELVEAL